MHHIFSGLLGQLSSELYNLQDCQSDDWRMPIALSVTLSIIASSVTVKCTVQLPLASYVRLSIASSDRLSIAVSVHFSIASSVSMSIASFFD